MINHNALKNMFDDPDSVSKIREMIDQLASSKDNLSWNEKQLVTLKDGYPERTDTAEFREADTYNDLGWQHHQLRKFEEALNYYDDAIALCPEYPTVWNNKGLAHFRLLQFEDARKAYLQAIRCNPRFIKPYSNMGILYCEIKRDYNNARQWFEMALTIDPNYHRAIEYLNKISEMD